MLPGFFLHPPFKRERKERASPVRAMFGPTEKMARSGHATFSERRKGEVRRIVLRRRWVRVAFIIGVEPLGDAALANRSRSTARREK